LLLALVWITLGRARRLGRDYGWMFLVYQVYWLGGSFAASAVSETLREALSPSDHYSYTWHLHYYRFGANAEALHAAWGAGVLMLLFPALFLFWATVSPAMRPVGPLLWPFGFTALALGMWIQDAVQQMGGYGYLSADQIFMWFSIFFVRVLNPLPNLAPNPEELSWRYGDAVAKPDALAIALIVIQFGLLLVALWAATSSVERHRRGLS
jgi:hypothetical protein